MVEHGAIASPRRESKPNAGTESAPFGPPWVSRIFADRRAKAVGGIAALALGALTLGVPLSTIFLFGIVLFCPLMMLGMHGMHGDHHGHAGGDPMASGEGGVQSDRALDILRERYAQGELAREQYEDMRRDLEQFRGRD